MPAKRRLPKGRNFIVTPAIVEAWKARDELALHRACGLQPWGAVAAQCRSWRAHADQRNGVVRFNASGC
jgi:hypothetical protein